MKQKRLRFFIFGLWILLGLSSKHCEGVSTVSDDNTAMRVLLDKAIPRGQVHSLLYSTFYRTVPERGWVTGQKHLKVEPSFSKKGQILVNGIALKEGFVFVRGGKSPSDKLQFHGQVFRGALEWIKKENGFSVINHLTLTDYLLGTLGSEMSASWEMEALKAQAVASRTYAHYMRRHPKSTLYDLESSTQDQVYGGVQAENKRVLEAIQGTRNEVLFFNNEPIKAFFHSRCGGSTESAAFVWSQREGFPQKQVSCPFCIENPFKWETQIKAYELLKWTGLEPHGNFKIEPGDRGPSGRLVSLNLIAGTQKASIRADLLRSRLGYTKLKSSRFLWHQEGDQINFQGVGNGHGVGMCQWGARYLAKQGKSYREILAHYYPGAVLKVLD